MIAISIEEIQKWRLEIEEAEKFREKQFGKEEPDNRTGAAENIDYYERGMSLRFLPTDSPNDIEEWPLATFNVIAPIVDNILPTLLPKEPHLIALPKRRLPEDEESAPIAGEILNYRGREINTKQTNKDITFDAYLYGMGVSKIGYTTKFGTIPTEESIKKEQKAREKSKLQKFKEGLGLSKPKEEKPPVANPEQDEFIRSESPFVAHINPFNFGIDPRATSIETADYVYEKVVKKLSAVKRDKSYKNTGNLDGDPINEAAIRKVPETIIDDFKVVTLYEVHYKTDEGINLLVLAKNGDAWRALRHDKSVYEIDGFQYEVLYFNKHRHHLYPRSDITKVKGLQDRINNTVENILEQVDKYVPKIFVDETALTEQGKIALRDGTIGAEVFTNKNPSEVVREGAFTQLKGDLLVLIDKVMEIIMLVTGLTRAQLMGLTQAETATEAQIGAAGQNLRSSQKFDIVSDFLTRQARKLWQVEKQFTNFEEISLITGDQFMDPQTNTPRYSWLPDITSDMSDKLARGEYRFDIEAGSTEKPDLAIIRKGIETLINILGGKGVLDAIAAQGFRVELVEIMKEWMNTFPNSFRNPGRIIKPIQPGNMAQAGVPQQQPQQGGMRQALGARPQEAQANPTNMADIISSLGGEKGQMPLA